MMLKVVFKNRFKKDLKKLKSSNRDHLLIGDYKDHRECHISPDWLLIFQVSESELTLVRTGSHSELFGK